MIRWVKNKMLSTDSLVRELFLGEILKMVQKGTKGTGLLMAI